MCRTNLTNKIQINDSNRTNKRAIVQFWSIWKSQHYNSYFDIAII